jgi:hypothetical protein
VINKKEASNEWRVVEVECRPDEGRMLEEKDERFALRKIVTKKVVSKINQRRDVKKPVNTGFKVENGRDSKYKLAGLMSHEVDRLTEERG